MPQIQVSDINEAADILSDAITEINAAAARLETKQPGRHSALAVAIMQFQTEQLSTILPVVREWGKNAATIEAPRA